MSILDKIIEDKRAEVEQKKSQIDIAQLKAEASAMPKCRNFFTAVTKTNKRGINVIAEVKKASPSAGIIRENFNPVEIARTYENCGADAISFQIRLSHIFVLVYPGVIFLLQIYAFSGNHIVDVIR